MASQSIECDVLVVGGGTAALCAALEASKFVDKVLVVCKRRAGRSGNTLVSGAAFSASLQNEEASDSIEEHLRDALRGGYRINDPELVRVLVSEAPERVMGLQEYGVRFLRADGSLVRRRPPGHSKPRSIPVDPDGWTHCTRGLSITLPLLRAARERGVEILDGIPICRLLVADGVACGAAGIDPYSGGSVILRAKATVVASGGGGHLFANTNNTSDMTGDSYALALEAGVPLRDMEFVQFYPTMMLWPARGTVSSPLFAEGAVLRNRHGERFMPRYDPAHADMVTRDVMSRAIFQEVQAGNGVQGGVYVDCSAVPRGVLEQKFPTLAHLLRSHSVDPSRMWLIVSPAVHFVMGGAWIDAWCRTTVAGLFAAGEAAGGVHGANRLSGNALSEAVVFGARAGHAAGVYARRLSRCAEPPRVPRVPAVRRGELGLAEVRARARYAMWQDVSIVRTGEGLRRASNVLADCLQVLPRCELANISDVVSYLELERMLVASSAIVAAALEREESRGAHFRRDFPESDDGRWLGSTQVRKAGEHLQVCFVPLGGKR